MYISIETPFTQMRLTMPPKKAAKLARLACEYADKSLKYSGFLLIKCPHCGKVRAFFTRTAIQDYHCECGRDTELKDLRVAYKECQCGNSLKYLTNIDEPEFDLACDLCGREARFRLGYRGTAYKQVPAECGEG